MLTPRQKSARKGARTRAANKASMKRWLEVDKPAHEQTVKIINRSLAANPVQVRFTPRDSGLRLVKGDGTGMLLKVLGTGLTWRVLVKGYKNPTDYYAGFWEVFK